MYVWTSALRMQFDVKKNKRRLRDEPSLCSLSEQSGSACGGREVRKGKEAFMVCSDKLSLAGICQTG